MDQKYHPKRFGFVYVSNSVILDRRPVVAMFRQDPNPDLPFSGWCFLCGEKGDPEDIDLYSVESLLAADPSLEPFLDEPIGSSFARTPDGTFEPESDEDEDEPDTPA
jgi:hypothetical protein